MNRMNAAYIRLKQVLPGHQEQVALSKKQTVQQVLLMYLHSERISVTCYQETLSRNVRDHWIPSNQSEYSLFAALILL